MRNTKKLLAVSLVALMAVGTAHAEIASTEYVNARLDTKVNTDDVIGAGEWEGNVTDKAPASVAAAVAIAEAKADTVAVSAQPKANGNIVVGMDKGKWGALTGDVEYINVGVNGTGAQVSAGTKLTAMDTKVGQHETDIADLKSKVGTKSVADQIAEKVGDFATKAYVDAADDQIKKDYAAADDQIKKDYATADAAIEAKVDLKENSANKVTSLASADNTTFPTTKAVVDAIETTWNEAARQMAELYTTEEYVDSKASETFTAAQDYADGVAGSAQQNAYDYTDRAVAGKATKADITAEIEKLDGKITGETGVVKTISQTDGIVTATRGTVDTADITANAVTTAKIKDANVTTAKIADDAVTTVKIKDANVTTAKIADKNVTAAKLADDITAKLNNISGKQDTLNSGTGGNVTTSGSGAVVTGVTANAGTVTVTKGDLSYNSLTDKPTIPAAYTLPVAGDALGGVKNGGNVTVGTDGKMTYTLPTASNTTLGGVKVDNSTITVTSGVISAKQYDDAALNKAITDEVARAKAAEAELTTAVGTAQKDASQALTNAAAAQSAAEAADTKAENAQTTANGKQDPIAVATTTGTGNVISSITLNADKKTINTAKGITAEETKNRVTTISATSTDTTYPTAKAVYTALDKALEEIAQAYIEMPAECSTGDCALVKKGDGVAWEPIGRASGK